MSIQQIPVQSSFSAVKAVLSGTLILLTGYTLYSDPVYLSDEQQATEITTGFVDINSIELGRLLFWDPILSGGRELSCASCHHPDFAYADGRALSIGSGGIGLGPARIDTTDGRIPPVIRNSTTVLNTVFNGLDDGRGRGREEFQTSLAEPDILADVNQGGAPMFWDSRVRSLETQALEPLKARNEMRGDFFDIETAVDSVVARLKAIPEYVTLFHQVFGEDTDIDAGRLGTTLADFQRSLTAINSSFDQHNAGREDAMTPQQIRGFNTFIRVGCDECHEGPMFSDFDLHTLGIAENTLVAEADTGAGRFRFRTPSLRNVALTAPYMHNGMLETLDDVLEFYDDGRSENPNVSNGGRGRGNNQRFDNRLAVVDGDFRRINNMDQREIQDIIAFLEALTDENFDRLIPDRVPSGLPVGGLIANE